MKDSVGSNEFRTGHLQVAIKFLSTTQTRPVSIDYKLTNQIKRTSENTLTSRNSFESLKVVIYLKKEFSPSE